MAAYWDDKKGEIVPSESVDISIAVATEKVKCQYDYWKVFEGVKLHYSILLQGLMTPILRNADQKSISAISLEVC